MIGSRAHQKESPNREYDRGWGICFLPIVYFRWVVSSLGVEVLTTLAL